MQSLSGVVLSRDHDSHDTQQDIVQDALHAIRTHLGMDVAFLAEFSGDTRIYRNIDSDTPLPVQPGDATPLDETYCKRVVEGRLPRLIPDTSLVPEAMALPVTTQFGIGAYLTAPIYLKNGQVYGTLCCLRFAPDPSLGERDMAILNLFGDFVGCQIERALAVRMENREMLARVRAMLKSNDFSIVYQPIYGLDQERILGFEALTRFTTQPERSPDIWFNEAAHAGVGTELEMASIAKAIEGFAHLPEAVFLSLNVSPDNILNGAVVRALAAAPLQRVVLEITEHHSVADYAKLALMLSPLRARGLRLAVDDAGAGYASFRHILNLRPDLIKLDISITRDIDSQVARRALAAAVVHFAQETGSKVVAEGVESEAELEVLRALGVNEVQGYLIGRPMPVADAGNLLYRTHGCARRMPEQLSAA